MTETLDFLLAPARPIVVAFRDGLTGPAILRWAAQRSRSTGQHLVLLHALPDPSLVLPVAAGGTPYGSLIAAARQSMDVEARQVCEEYPGTHVTANVHSGDVVEALLGHSEDAALIVVGADRRDGQTGEYLGSIGQQVALGSAAPVVVIPRGAAGGSWADLGGVVVGVDGSPESYAALRVAANEAARSNRPLRVVTSSGNQPTRETSAGKNPDAGMAHPGLADALAELHADYPDLVISRVIEEQLAPDQALSFNASGASLVVIGRHGKWARPGIRLGSVTHTLLLNPPCPTMVITRRLP